MKNQIFEGYLEKEGDYGKVGPSAGFVCVAHQAISSDNSVFKNTQIYDCTSTVKSATDSTQYSKHLLSSSSIYEREQSTDFPFNQEPDIQEDTERMEQEYSNMASPLTICIETTKPYEIVLSCQEISKCNEEKFLEMQESPQKNLNVGVSNFHMKNKLYAFLHFLILTVLYGLGSKHGKLYKKKGTGALSKAQELTLSLLQGVLRHERAPQLKEYLETVLNILSEFESKVIKKIALALTENLDFGLLVCCWLEELLLSEFFLSEMIFSCWVEGCRMSAENKAGLKCHKQEFRDEVAEIKSYLSVCSQQLDLIQGDGEKAKFLERIRSETDTFKRLSKFMSKKKAIFQKIAKELEGEKKKKIKTN